MTTRGNARAQGARRTGPPKGPRTPRLRGRGDYSADVSGETDYAKRLEKKIDHLERSLVHATPTIARGASMAGRALGSMLGQGDLGAFAGEQLSKLFGYGDYKIKGNSLMSEISGTTVPKFQGDGKRGTRTTQREFIGNIKSGPLVGGSSAFNNTVYALNPTDPSTFPWLSKMARLYDQWEPHGIVFEFHTTSSTFNGTSQALGAVIMATDYDAVDPPYTSKQVMENADYACSTVPSSNLLHGVECDPRERPLEVLYSTIRPNNPNFSSLGNFQIATQGCSTADTTLGELWISYDITFYKKQLVGAAEDTSSLSFSGTSTIGNALLNPQTIFVQRNISIVPVIGVGTDIVLPPSQGVGTFTYVIYVVKSGMDGIDSPPIATNCTVSNLVYSFNVDNWWSMASATVVITSPGARIRFGLKAGHDSEVSFLLTEVPQGTHL